MKGNIVLDSYINFLIKQIEDCNKLPNLKRKCSYCIGSIRSLFIFGHLSRDEYFSYTRLALLRMREKRSAIMKPFIDDWRKEANQVERGAEQVCRLEHSHDAR